MPFDYLGEVTVAPVTSTIRDIPSEILLSRLDGLPRDCAMNLDHIQTVSKGRIGALITTLSSDKMAALRHALLFALGFDDRGHASCRYASSRCMAALHSILGCAISSAFCCSLPQVLDMGLRMG